MSFSPSEILYIVLSFCILWISGALFWFIWQAANILRNINTVVDEAREKIGKIESAITAIKNRFEAMTGPAQILVEGVKKVLDYALEKRRERREEDV